MSAVPAYRWHRSTSSPLGAANRGYAALHNPSLRIAGSFPYLRLSRHAGGERRRRADPLSAGVVPIGDRDMTKARPIFEDALLRVLGDLTPARCALITGRAEAYLREASDPDRPQRLTVEDMHKLDVEHLAFDGTTPLFAAYGALIAQARAEVYADAVAIGRATKDVLKEDGEAHLALFIASQPDATDHDLRAALRETEEAIAAQSQAVQVVRVALEKRHPQPP